MGDTEKLFKKMNAMQLCNTDHSKLQCEVHCIFFYLSLKNNRGLLKKKKKKSAQLGRAVSTIRGETHQQMRQNGSIMAIHPKILDVFRMRKKLAKVCKMAHAELMATSSHTSED